MRTKWFKHIAIILFRSFSYFRFIALMKLLLSNSFQARKIAQIQTFWSGYVRPKSSVCPSKPRETKLFGGISRDFGRDIPGAPESLREKRFVFNSRPLFESLRFQLGFLPQFGDLKITSASTERQKCSQNLAPALVILSQFLGIL